MEKKPLPFPVLILSDSCISFKVGTCIPNINVYGKFWTDSNYVKITT